jgi:hypothetical protein
MGGGGSSAVAGRSDLGPAPGEDDEARLEKVLWVLGVRGGVMPPTLCSELRDVRFCKVGVFVRSTLPMELELGVRRKGLFCGSWGPCVDEYPFLCLSGDETGEDGGSAVAAAVLSDRRLRLSESLVPSLFVDFDMSKFAECPCSLTVRLRMSILKRTQRHLQSDDRGRPAPMIYSLHVEYQQGA